VSCTVAIDCAHRSVAVLLEAPGSIYAVMVAIPLSVLCADVDTTNKPITPALVETTASVLSVSPPIHEVLTVVAEGTFTSNIKPVLNQS
jgi:hypothetical protein